MSLMLETDSHVTQATLKIFSVAKEDRELLFSCLHLPSSRIVSMHPHAWFVWCCKVAPRVLCHARPTLYQPGYISQSLMLLIYKTPIWYYLCICVCVVHVCGCGQV